MSWNYIDKDGNRTKSRKAGQRDAFGWRFVEAPFREGGEQGIEERSHVDISLENGVQTITIPDKQGGARWYGIRLSKGRP